MADVYARSFPQFDSQRIGKNTSTQSKNIHKFIILFKYSLKSYYISKKRTKKNLSESHDQKLK